MRIIPAAWMGDAQAERIVTHWTAGAYGASTVDREHYHYLLEGPEGRIVRGDHTPADNDRTGDGDYAAHTKGLNTKSIGIAVCCMAGATESPFQPGRFPLTSAQWEAMAQAVADLCERYGIPCDPRHVLGHGEVEAVLGIAQRGKWDPLRLPWERGWNMATVGESFRRRVRVLLAEEPVSRPDAPPIRVEVDGREITDEAQVIEGTTWAPIRPLAMALGWSVVAYDEREATLRETRHGVVGRAVRVPFQLRGDRGYAPVRPVLSALELPAPEWDAAARVVRIRTR